MASAVKTSLSGSARVATCVARRSLREAPLLHRPLTQVCLLSSRSFLPPPTAAVGAPRWLSTTAPFCKGLSPESEEPPSPNVSETSAVPAVPADISEAQYHELADEYLETVLSRFEEIQDDRDDVDVEFAAGVLTVSFPAAGTYVINKQPPNKQIWLSSPRSGPKRYDWVVLGDGQSEKQGTGRGDWVYIRDGSTLNELFINELGVDISVSSPH